MSWRSRSSLSKNSSATNLSRTQSQPYVCPTQIAKLQTTQPKPVRLVRTQRQQVRHISNSWTQVPARHFDGNVPLIGAEIEFNRLRRAREIIHDQNFLGIQLAYIRQ